MTGPVTHAVIPAAGLGTRSLPATKAVPKELLPVVDRPAIDYTVAEAVAAGLSDLTIVSSAAKPAIDDHFGPNAELERQLVAAGRHAAADRLRAIGSGARITVVHQERPLGLGDAVASAGPRLEGRPFAVLLPDRLLPTAPATLAGLLAAHQATGCTVVSLGRVAADRVGRYGCVAVDDEGADPLTVVDLVEKPPPELAPSTLVIQGRYVCTPAVLDHLTSVEPGVDRERQLSDALGELARLGRLRGRVDTRDNFDLGDPIDHLRATVEVGLDHPELGAQFADALRETVRRRGIE